MIIKSIFSLYYCACKMQIQVKDQEPCSSTNIYWSSLLREQGFKSLSTNYQIIKIEKEK